MGRLVRDDRKATVTQNNHSLQPRYAKFHLWTHNTSNPEADGLQQKKTGELIIFIYNINYMNINIYMSIVSKIYCTCVYIYTNIHSIHITASALAKELGATECMAHGHLAHQSDAWLLAYADPLAQYYSVSLGHSYWPSDQEKDCYDRCIEHGLGSRMQWQTNLRVVVRNWEAVAHKLSGAPCCTPSTRMLSPGHSPPSRSHKDG